MSSDIFLTVYLCVGIILFLLKDGEVIFKKTDMIVHDYKFIRYQKLELKLRAFDSRSSVLFS